MALILTGNCLDELKKLDDNSVDSIVTDPPYGLSFMGKKWDYDVPSVDVWRECLRVIKPGGHLLAFSGSRTYHRMVVNIEDGGFEIRDQIMWLYGSGFPKSHNISKAIDKESGYKGQVVGSRTVDVGMQSGSMHTGRESVLEEREVRELSPEAKQWEGWGTALKPAHEPVVVARKPLQGTVAENVLEHGTGGINIDESRVGTEGGTRKPEPTPQTPTVNAYGSGLNGGGCESIDAGRFPANVIHDGSEEVIDAFPHTKGTVPDSLGQDGFWFDGQGVRSNRQISPGYSDEGSAARYFKETAFSKQEHEPIVLARKPLEGTVAENVLEHGTGGLNIDASRVGDLVQDTSKNGREPAVHKTTVFQSGLKKDFEGEITVGRFPSNVIHDGSEEIVEGFPETTSGKPGIIRKGTNDGAAFGDESRAPGTPMTGFGDSGSAARFFYCAKTSTAERNAGLDEMEDKEMGRNQSSLDGGKMLTGSGNERSNLKKNFHPTVKPIALMEYLCRLVTPPGGVVLDPFMGSGTTGIAALRLGFEFIGVELSPEYVEIATTRIAHWVDAELTFEGEDIVLEKKPEAEWL